MSVDAGSAVTVAFLAIFAICALTDFWLLRIPNVFVVVLVLLFGLSAWLWPERIEIWEHLATGAAAFLLGAILFFLGQFGGGDVKLLAAAALWTGYEALPYFLVCLGVTGAILLLVYLLGRTAMEAAAHHAAQATGGRFPVPRSLTIATHIPYGIVIGVSAIVTAKEIPLLHLEGLT